ncbi:putative phosphatidylglycerol/ phosphatidylinositol transfer protein ddb_g0282179 [Phtheirospermum japonicum]|uniref:Putative phosphatidylglycerol/ phosphatidylinositol transfer protein ddb_g0282179 n=1 Tax=Phtheirospermum japonicum TaxID=374723 RepID=A0A830CUG1_9LAMI|nr:putative phosphatidylglycerol/ phosphatidylinositol transfer protein ddb_g0282179 [Phtheirospermum japonicum]
MAQMKVLGGLVFALCLLVPLISAKTTDVEYCSKKTDYAVKVNALDIDPYPISKGKNTKFQITASTNEAISGGKLVIDVSYFGFHLHSEDHDLCVETSCPVSVGDFNVTHAQALPLYTPPGSYTLQMKMVDGGGHQLTCITFGFSIGFFAEENNLADI